MKTLTFPKVKGGRVTGCNYDPDGNVTEVWITLDADITSIEFESEFNIVYSGRVHLTTVAGSNVKK
jgi:hypothetical protein